jgi:cell division protein ZipA
MTELRWILLAAGVVLIVGLYLWGVRARQANRPGGEQEAEEARPAGHGREPVFDAEEHDREFARGGAGTVPSEDEIDAQYSTPALARRVEPGVSATAEYDDDEPSARREPTLGRGRIEPTLAQRLEPNLRARDPDPPAVAPDAGGHEPAEAREPARTTSSERPQRPSQRIFAIRVSATPPARFEGQRVLEALAAEGLGFGKYDIFHRLHADGRPVFSVASLREPGTFDLEQMPGTTYPGIALFAVLPGPVPAAEAFDQMLFTARALATLLEGALADERGVPLTALRVARLREETLEFERGLPGGPGG